MLWTTDKSMLGSGNVQGDQGDRTFLVCYNISSICQPCISVLNNIFIAHIKNNSVLKNRINHLGNFVNSKLSF